MHKTTGEAGGTTAGEVERLVQLYSDSILRLSYSYLRSTHDAEDICQDVLLKLLTARPSFASDEHERAWVIRTTANACKDQLRAARRKDTTLEGAREPATEGDPTFQGLLDEEADLLRALRELPDQYREVIHLHYFEELPLREIARMTGVSEAAATKRLSRARKLLRTRLAEQGDC